MGKIRRRSRCPKCGSLNVIKWGIQCNCQRYKCKDCQSCFTPTRPDVSAPERKIQHRKAYHVLIDGTWFSENHCLIVYRDADSKSTIYYRFAETGNEYEIIKDLQAFKTMRLRISSFTTDGGDDIIRAIKYVAY